MRYFIYYPPTKAIRLLDACEDDRIEKILELARHEFGLKFSDDVPSSATIVLSYNGFDLKPKWTLGELNIPVGAIIRCISREQFEADIYVHCGYNKQIFKLFDFPISYRNDFKKRNSLKLRCKTNHFPQPNGFLLHNGCSYRLLWKTAGCHLENEVTLNGTPTSLLLSQHLEILYQ